MGAARFEQQSELLFLPRPCASNAHNTALKILALSDSIHRQSYLLSKDLSSKNGGAEVVSWCTM